MADAGKARAPSASYAKARTRRLRQGRRGGRAGRVGRAGARRAPTAPTTPWPRRSGSPPSAPAPARATPCASSARTPTCPRGDTEVLAPTPEDDGSIPLAGDTGIATEPATVTVSAELGDGPHGPAGDDSNDFDFYEVDIPAGLSLVGDTSDSGSLDTILAVYDETGELVAVDDDGGSQGFTSRVTYTPETPGTYYLMVAGYSFFGPLPADPFDSGSGAGLADIGDYELSIAVGPVDADNYAVRLQPGRRHRRGRRRRGDRAHRLPARRPADGRLAGRPRRLVALPAQLAAARRRQHHAGLRRREGRLVRPARSAAAPAPTTSSSRATGPAPSSTPTRSRRSTSTSRAAASTPASGAAPGVRTLSPFSSFLGKWGINANRQDAMITKVTAEVKENIRDEVKASGLNPNLEVRGRQLAQPPRGRGQAERLARLRRRHHRPVGHPDDRHRAVHRPGQLRARGRRPGAPRRAERPGRRPRLAEHLPHRGQRPGGVRLAGGRQRDRPRDRAHGRQLPHRQPVAAWPC